MKRCIFLSGLRTSQTSAEERQIYHELVRAKGSGIPEEEGQQRLTEQAKLEEISRLLKGKEPCDRRCVMPGSWQGFIGCLLNERMKLSLGHK